MKFSTFLLLLLSPMFCQFVLAQPGSADKKVFITNEATINSNKLEYSPAFLEDGIVFISSRPASRKYKVKDKRFNTNIMSIYRAKREENGLLKQPEPFARELLSTVHEGPLTFDRTADNMFFTRNNVTDGKMKKAKDGIVKLKIYTAERIDSTWQNIEELPFNDDESNTCHPAISVAGDALYFASDRPGGFGGMDIWVAYRKGGLWSTPENLGASINTETDEVFPFIHADGTLYFASNGHAGHGGLDLFSAQNDAGEWNPPINMGTPINSETDDFGFIIDRDKKNGYFSSNRGGGLGADDIYSFYVNGGLDDLLGIEPIVDLTPKKLIFLVSDLSSGAMIDSARITYVSLANQDFSTTINAITEENADDSQVIVEIPESERKRGVTDSFGKFPATVDPGNYVFLIEKLGYTSQQILVNSANEEGEIFVSLAPVRSDSGENGGDLTSTSDDPNSNPGGDNPGEDTENEDFGSDFENNSTGENTASSENTFPSTIKEGTVFQLPNIYYNFNDASIRPDARIDLDALATFLMKYPDIKIELSSHTDSRGGTRYNRRLSQQRAENAVNYLASRGIERSRMVPLGFGEEQLRNDCTDGADCTELEHQYNRRTEVKITEISQEINIQFVTDDSMPETVADYGRQSRRGSDAGGDDNTYYPSSETGEFKVVAGVFGSISNAEKRLNILQDLGYAAEMLNLGDDTNYTIVVQRFTDFDEARGLVQELKRDHSIRSFIKR